MRRYQLLILMTPVLLLSACTSQPKATLPYTQCKEPRPQICTREYRPVCAEVDTGIRCVTTPCASTKLKTYATGCTACADPKVIGYRPGACEAVQK